MLPWGAMPLMSTDLLPSRCTNTNMVCAVQSLETLGRTAFPRAEPVYPSVAAGGPSSHHPASKDEHKEGLTC